MRMKTGVVIQRPGYEPQQVRGPHGREWRRCHWNDLPCLAYGGIGGIRMAAVSKAVPPGSQAAKLRTRMGVESRQNAALAQQWALIARATGMSKELVLQTLGGLRSSGLVAFDSNGLNVVTHRGVAALTLTKRRGTRRDRVLRFLHSMK